MSPTLVESNPIIVMGAGPAGLTAAVELCRQPRAVTVLEQAAQVGGIARTETYKGYHFDIGGHRFFTKVPEVEKFWLEMLGGEFLARPRLSRIFYEGKFFDYPLRPLNALQNLGGGTSLAVGLSYLQSQIFPFPREDTFEQWVCNRFGRKLYSIFFKTYTEKVWGLPCSEIRAEWAAQRIQGLSLPIAIKNAFLGPGSQGLIKSLIQQFHYPRLGPGMMWQAAADYVTTHGGQVTLKAKVIALHHVPGRVTEVVIRTPTGEQTLAGEAFISTLPLSELILKLNPPPPPEVVEAARGLTYRDFLTVVLLVGHPALFPDNWIYIHSPEVRVGRVQNFRNWSPDMVPDPATTSLGLEYFCTEGDDLWDKSDAELIELGKREMEQIGLVRAAEVFDGTVIRQPKAYPIYNATYAGYLAILKDYLRGFSNLQTVGRNGLHKYNNQDHSMLTAMLAVRNLTGGAHDVWDVNLDRSYHEEISLPPHSALSSDEAGTPAGYAAPRADSPAPTETGLLLAALRVGQTAAAWQADCERAQLNWDSLVVRAIVLGLAPQLHQQLTTWGITPPARAAAKLAVTYQMQTKRNTAIFAQLGEVLQAGAARGLHPIALKGVHLAALIYPAPALRPMNDIDLLFTPAELPEAENLLAALGYGGKHKSAAQGPGIVKHTSTFQRPGGAGATPNPYLSTDSERMVEPHTSLEESWFGLGVNITPGLRERAVWAELGGQPGRVLSPEDLMLHLCVHFSFHFIAGSPAMVQLLDLKAVAQAGVRWSVLAHRAVERGAAPYVLAALTLAHQLLAVPATIALTDLAPHVAPHLRQRIAALDLADLIHRTQQKPLTTLRDRLQRGVADRAEAARWTTHWRDTWRVWETALRVSSTDTSRWLAGQITAKLHHES